MQTLKPGVWGYLTLYSSVYPGPGFSGKYDWAGELELSPDPFQEWTDATSLLVVNSTASKPLTSGRRRALLQQSTTGLVPVQGRVAIKESKTVVDNSGSTSGVLALDDSGDIQLVCGSNCPDMGQPQLGAPEQAGSSPTADSSTNTGASGNRQEEALQSYGLLCLPCRNKRQEHIVSSRAASPWTVTIELQFNAGTACRV